VDSFPLELEYRLTFGDRVLWWGRPGRLAAAGLRDLALLPVILIAAATAAMVAFAPGPTWHPVVTTIFRLGFAVSGVALIATHLAIVVRQRRRRFYAITRDRVLLANDFWSGGFRAVPLDRISDATVDAAADGDGTITLVVDDGTRPRLADIADAHGVRTTVMAARADVCGRMTGSVPLEIVEHLAPDERVLWWGRPKQGWDVFGHTRMRGILVMGPIYLAVSWAIAGTESGIGTKVIAAILSLLVLGLGLAVVSIDAERRFNTLYAITDQHVLVLGWQRRHGRRTFRLALAGMRYYPSMTVRAKGTGTIRFTTDGWFKGNKGGLADDAAPTFDRIADVRAVHAILISATKLAGGRVPGDEASR
jgi:hypothetical protein